MGWDPQLSGFELLSKRAFQCTGTGDHLLSPFQTLVRPRRFKNSTRGCGLRTAAGAKLYKH
eukprot:scaffold9553_cov114-Isochrysis_galbana.AAC.8